MKFKLSTNTIIVILLIVLLILLGVCIYFLVKPKENENIESNVLSAMCVREGCKYGYNCQKYNCRNCPECKDVERWVG